MHFSINEEMRKLFYEDKKKHDFMMLAHYTTNYNTEEYKDLKRFEFPFSKRRYAELLNITEWDVNKATGELVESKHIEWVKKSKSRHKSSIMKNLMAEKTHKEITTSKTISSLPSNSTSKSIDNKGVSDDLQPVCQPVKQPVTQPLSNKYISNKDNLYSYMSDSKEYRLADLLYKHILKNNPKAKEPNLQSWAKTFDYILRIDKREIEEVKKLIVFSQEHNFWYKNILSPDKLRKQYDRLLLEINEVDKPKNNNGNINNRNQHEDDNCGWSGFKKF